METGIKNKSTAGFDNSASTKKHEQEAKTKEEKRIKSKTEGSNAFRTSKKKDNK